MTLEKIEREGMTFWGQSISAQVRNGEIALVVRVGAKLDRDDGAVLLGPVDSRKLGELIQVATEGGEL